MHDAGQAIERSGDGGIDGIIVVFLEIKFAWFNRRLQIAYSGKLARRK